MDNIWHFRIVQPAACNSTTCHSTVQRSSTEYDSLWNTILIDRMRSLATISLCTIQDPWEIIFSSNDRSNMIFEHDRRKGCVESIVSDGPDWTEGGPKVDRGRTRLWLFWGWYKNVSCSTGKLIGWVMSYFKVNNKLHFGLKLKRNRGPNSGQPRLTVTGDC